MILSAAQRGVHGFGVYSAQWQVLLVLAHFKAPQLSVAIKLQASFHLLLAEQCASELQEMKSTCLPVARYCDLCSPPRAPCCCPQHRGSGAGAGFMASLVACNPHSCPVSD